MSDIVEALLSPLRTIIICLSREECSQLFAWKKVFEFNRVMLTNLCSLRGRRKKGRGRGGENCNLRGKERDVPFLLSPFPSPFPFPLPLVSTPARQAKLYVSHRLKIFVTCTLTVLLPPHSRSAKTGILDSIIKSYSAPTLRYRCWEINAIAASHGFCIRVSR